MARMRISFANVNQHRFFFSTNQFCRVDAHRAAKKKCAPCEAACSLALRGIEIFLFESHAVLRQLRRFQRKKKMRQKTPNTCLQKKSSYNLPSAGAPSSECSK